MFKLGLSKNVDLGILFFFLKKKTCSGGLFQKCDREIDNKFIEMTLKPESALHADRGAQRGVQCFHCSNERSPFFFIHPYK